jgi:hypothetical protein
VVAPKTQVEAPRLDLQHGRLPDPIVEALRNLEARIETLERAAALPIGQCPVTLVNDSGSDGAQPVATPSASEPSPQAETQAPAD